MKNIDTSFLRAANELEGAVLLALLCLLGCWACECGIGAFGTQVQMNSDS